MAALVLLSEGMHHARRDGLYVSEAYVPTIDTVRGSFPRAWFTH